MDEQKKCDCGCEGANCDCGCNCSYLKKAKAGLIILIVAVFAIWGITDIVNKIKEGRYIGQDAQYKNTISISGEGKVLAKPDIGQVSLTVFTQKTTVAAAQSENSKKMNAVLEGMKKLGVKDDDLKTTVYQINPTYQYSSGRSLIIGYEVRQTLSVKIRDLEKASEILDKAAMLGANEVGSLNFAIDDEEKLKEEAREKAVKQAKEKAETLAKTLGIKLGKVTSFSESSGIPYPQTYYSEKAISAIGMGGGGVAPDIQTGQNEITVSVVLNYEIY